MDCLCAPKIEDLWYRIWSVLPISGNCFHSTTIPASPNPVDDVTSSPFEKSLSLMSLARSVLWDCIKNATSTCEPVVSQEHSVTLISDSGETAIISRARAIQILSQDIFGNEKRVDLAFRGHHPVVPLENVHFKNNLRLVPIDPMMEMAMYDLYTLLFGNLLAPSRCLVAEGVPITRFASTAPLTAALVRSVVDGTQESFLQEHPEYQQHLVTIRESFVLQASQSASGIRLKEYLEQAHSSQESQLAIDLSSFSKHFILSLLTRAADHKAENFIVQEKDHTLVGVDNDYVFHPSNVHKEADGGFAEIQFFGGAKNQLFMLPALMRQALDESTRQTILALNPEELLLQWLCGLQRRNENITAGAASRLSTRQQREVYLPLRLSPGTVSRLVKELCALQLFLEKHPHATHQEAFEFLLPDLASYYSWMQKQYSDPMISFKKLYGNERPLEEGRVPNARLGAGALKGRWLFESLNAFKKERSQSLLEATTELITNVDLEAILRRQDGVNTCIRMVRLLHTLTDESFSLPVDFNLDSLRHVWFHVLGRLTSQTPIGLERSTNVIEDQTCSRLLKNREDVELRKLVLPDILEALKTDRLPPAMKALQPYDFLTEILIKNPSHDSSVDQVLEEYCMRPTVYEDFVVFSFQISAGTALPPGIRAAEELLKRCNGG